MRLSTFFVTVPFSLSMSTLAREPSLAKLLNSFNKFEPVSKYKVELFFKFNLSIIDNVNNTSEYSLVRSVAPFKTRAELSIVKVFVL